MIGLFIGLGAPLNHILAMLDALPLVLVDADEKLGFEAGAVLEVTRVVGLTLGARFCLALAKRIALPAIPPIRLGKLSANSLG